MRKIDDSQHERLTRALSQLEKDLKRMQSKEVARQVDSQRRELQVAYRNYARSIKRLADNISQYEDVFDSVYANYRSTLRQKGELQKKGK